MIQKWHPIEDVRSLKPWPSISIPWKRHGNLVSTNSVDQWPSNLTHSSSRYWWVATAWFPGCNSLQKVSQMPTLLQLRTCSKGKQWITTTPQKTITCSRATKTNTWWYDLLSCSAPEVTLAQRPFSLSSNSNYQITPRGKQTPTPGDIRFFQ